MRVFQHVFATALISIWLILRLVRRRGLPQTPLNPLLYLCVIVWVISTLASLDPRMALENLWFPVTNLLLFFMMVDLVQSGQEGLLVEAQFLLAAVVVMLAGVQLGSWFFGWGFATATVGWASVLGKEIPLPLVSPRLFVPLGVTTWLAAYTAPLAVLIGAWGLAARQRAARSFLMLLALLLVLIMLLTDSRGGWISLGAGVVVFGGLHVLRSERLRQTVRRYAIPLLVAAAAVAAVSLFVVYRIGQDPGHSTGDVLRFDLWRGAVDVIADHPFLGVGPGLFGTVYRLYRDPATVDNRLGTAHNFYLNSVAENGIVGGIVLLALGVVLLRTWWKLWRTAETPTRQTHLEGALAALIGFGVQSFFDTFTSMALVLLALGLTAYCVTQPRSRLDAPPKGSVVAAWASLIVVLMFGAGMLRSDQAQAAFIASTNGAPDQAQQAVALDPGMRLYTLQTAYLTGLNGDTAQAIAAYQQALDLEPSWDTGWINLAALFERQGATAQALDALQKAMHIDERDGSLLLWAQLAEATKSAPADEIVSSYTRYLITAALDYLPLSSFWSQTDLRQQALTAYEKRVRVDLRYRVTAAQDPADRATSRPDCAGQQRRLVGRWRVRADRRKRRRQSRTRLQRGDCARRDWRSSGGFVRVAGALARDERPTGRCS